MAATITRTIITARAYAWKMEGFNDQGMPNMVKVGNVEFKSTNPTKGEAFKVLKGAKVAVSKDFVDFEKVGESVYAMTLDEFVEHAHVVERSRNGRVKGVADESDAE
jgi:hypothetical protein